MRHFFDLSHERAEKLFLDIESQLETGSSQYSYSTLTITRGRDALTLSKDSLRSNDCVSIKQNILSERDLSNIAGSAYKAHPYTVNHALPLLTEKLADNIENLHKTVADKSRPNIELEPTPSKKRKFSSV